jgi:polyhydroxybutyrate depolymerase
MFSLLLHSIQIRLLKFEQNNSMKVKIIIATLFCFLLVSVGYAQTTFLGSFQHNGILRTYSVYRPAIYNPATPVPLLFNLHGYGSNNIEQEFYADFRPIADTAGFIVVHPNGTLDGLNNRFWNVFGGSAVDDIGFLSALIDTISAGYNINPNRIYSTGMSNGGFMSYDLACALSERIAAIASVTGSMTYARLSVCNVLHPMPVMEIHGTADGTVPYPGSAVFVPVDSLVNYWARFNHCTLIPVITPVPDINILDGCTAQHYVYANGNLGSAVELYKIIGGGHTWPGSNFIIGVTNMDFSASTEIWRFLSRYNLNGLNSASADIGILEVTDFKVYPNPSRDKFILSFADFSEKTISIANYSGQLIQRYTSSADKEVLNIDAKGIYFVTVTSGKQTLTKKIIKY